MTVVYDSFWEDLPITLVTVCILELGLFMMVLGIILAKHKDSSEMWDVGLFAVFLGIYALSGNQFNLIMLSNPYFGYLINFWYLQAYQSLCFCFLNQRSLSDSGNGIMPCWPFVESIIIQVSLHFGRIRIYANCIDDACGVCSHAAAHCDICGQDSERWIWR